MIYCKWIRWSFKIWFDSGRLFVYVVGSLCRSSSPNLDMYTEADKKWKTSARTAILFSWSLSFQYWYVTSLLLHETAPFAGCACLAKKWANHDDPTRLAFSYTYTILRNIYKWANSSLLPIMQMWFFDCLTVTRLHEGSRVFNCKRRSLALLCVFLALVRRWWLITVG